MNWINDYALSVAIILGALILVTVCVRYWANKEFNFARLGFGVLGMTLVALPVLSTINFEVSPTGLKAQLAVVSQKLDNVQIQVSNVEAKLDTTLDLRRRQLREPSGLTAAGRLGENQYAVVVDDDQKGIFFVSGLPNRTKEYGPRFFDYKGFQGKDPDDFEAICFDDLAYFAITSHRRLGDKDINQRRLIRFEISDGWEKNEYQIALGDDQVRDLGELLEKKLASWNIQVDPAAWRKKKTTDRYERYPYALEVEGLACSAGRLLIGLKWPLHERRAVLIEYDWNSGAFVGDPTLLDLGGMGISGLEFSPQRNRLLVAANPPEKVWDDDSTEVHERYYGSSHLYVFALNSSGRPDVLLSKYANVARRGAKLEGIAVVNDELWLAYDGHEPAIVRKALFGGLLN